MQECHTVPQPGRLLDSKFGLRCCWAAQLTAAVDNAPCVAWYCSGFRAWMACAYRTVQYACLAATGLHWGVVGSSREIVIAAGASRNVGSEEDNGWAMMLMLMWKRMLMPFSCFLSSNSTSSTDWPDGGRQGGSMFRSQKTGARAGPWTLFPVLWDIVRRRD